MASKTKQGKTKYHKERQSTNMASKTEQDKARQDIVPQGKTKYQPGK